MTRSVPEWIGKTPDQKVPDRVKVRIFDREGGVCHISCRKIMPGELWDLDHKIALINGGQHRESNLFPALKEPHKQKTKDDLAEKAEVYAKRAKHVLPTTPSKTPIPQRPKPERTSKPPVLGKTELQRRYGQ